MIPSTHYAHEAELLARAVLEGDVQTIDDVLLYLGSSNSDLRLTMQACLHDAPDGVLWRQMLYCITAVAGDTPALVSAIARRLQQHRRGEPIEPDAYRPLDIERVDQSIIEAFTLDESESERAIKERILRQALLSPEIHYSAVYLLALRGWVEMIPLLEELIVAEQISRQNLAGKKERYSPLWQIRAVRALAAIHDERCGAALVHALALDHGQVHQEARRALDDLGFLAEPAWIEALHHPDPHIRWHAARGLSALSAESLLRDPQSLRNSSSVTMLAAGLFDENQAVRWATARALAALDEAGVPAILTVLTQHELTDPFRQAAYYALRSMQNPQTQIRLAPLLPLLQRSGDKAAVPSIARRLLDEWDEYAAKS